MDIFCEYIVKKQRNVKDFLVIIGGYILAFVLTVLFLGIGAKYFNGLALLVICAFWYGAYQLAKSRYIEYEYALTNNELDVDKIVAKKRRKRILTIDFHNIELCAKADSEHMNDSQTAKQYDFTGESENDIYFVDYTNDSGRVRVLFQPTDRMKESIRLINPRNVHL